ncbi:MAG: hypothetical protein Q9183_006394 [Haloplaca sp. 2 TL-2023]
MRDKRHKAIERLFHQRMNHRWESMNERDLYLAFLAIGYNRGRCDEDESREGFVLDASTRDLNLISKLTDPSNCSNGRDLTEVSKSWKGLQDKGKIKELDKGQGQKSSTYFVPFDFGLDEGGDSDYLDSLHENPHTEGIPKEDNLGERVIPFYLKIMWSPTLNKNQRFLLEQILYGRNTLESLYDYFQIKRKDNFKKNCIGTLLDRELIVEAEFDGIIYYKVLVEGVEKLFDKSGRANLERYLEFVKEEQKVYRESGQKANLIKSNQKVLSYFRGELAEDELNTKERAEAFLLRNTSNRCEMLEQQIYQLSL